MLEELQRRHYSEGTTRYYIRKVEAFARYFHCSPDRLGPQHIREYQAHLFTKRKSSLGSVTTHLCALRFFTDLNSVLHESGRSEQVGRIRPHLRDSLVVAQIAGSLMLLVVAGLLVRSLRHAEHMFLGFDPDHVVSIMLDPHQLDYDQQRTKNFYRELERRVRALPSVQMASLARAVPMAYPSQNSPIYVETHALVNEQAPHISYTGVDPGYFATMRVPLLRGRSFTDSDDETAPLVAITNQTMAHRLWPGEDPIGKRFSLKNASGPFIQVVGTTG